MAIDLNNRILHLANGKREKSYPFSEVRNWRYNLSYGGAVVGGGAAGAGANLGNAWRNEQMTGFFVSVKDIDYPEWKIVFVKRFWNDISELEKEMKRWMEIFQQCLNEGKV